MIYKNGMTKVYEIMKEIILKINDMNYDSKKEIIKIIDELLKQ